jgi:cyclopropane fatty-acyl-phospholipid synthase-like methyltransferase
VRHEERTQVATHQRRRFNELVDAFDTPQPQEVMGRLEQIVAAARLRPGEAVLDVGTGVGVLIPLIRPYRAAAISACDLAERMLRRVREKHPDVRTYRAEIGLLKLDPASVEPSFENFARTGWRFPSHSETCMSDPRCRCRWWPRLKVAFRRGVPAM